MVKQSRGLTIYLSVVVALFVLSASIAVPILCRPFYYAHIEALDLVDYMGMEEAEIRRAYDEMLDFSIGLTDEFSAGVLPWSESGRDHFVDVKKLFLLDLGAMVVSGVLLAADFFLRDKRKLRPHRFLGRGPGFWAAAGLGGVFTVLGLLAATDFSRAFVIFHNIFFSGKTNWIFDWRTDAIILILPEVFFRNCAILAVALLLLWCAMLIAADLWLGRAMKPKCARFLKK